MWSDWTMTGDSVGFRWQWPGRDLSEETAGMLFGALSVSRFTCFTSFSPTKRVSGWLVTRPWAPRWKSLWTRSGCRQSRLGLFFNSKFRGILDTCDGHTPVMTIYPHLWGPWQNVQENKGLIVTKMEAAARAKASATWYSWRVIWVSPESFASQLWYCQTSVGSVWWKTGF